MAHFVRVPEGTKIDADAGEALYVPEGESVDVGIWGPYDSETKTEYQAAFSDGSQNVAEVSRYENWLDQITSLWRVDGKQKGETDLIIKHGKWYTECYRIKLVVMAKPSAARIAMTFDDGPNPLTTPKLLDLLDRLDLKVTFFVLGQQVKANGAIAKRIAAKHEIGNHTWDHKGFCGLNDGQIREELNKTHKMIADTVGVEPKLMRPPFGDISARQQSLIAKEFSYEIIGWNVDPEDWKQSNSPDAITRHITTKAMDGFTILAHDIHARTIEAMPATLAALKSKFTLVTVSRLGNFTHAALAPAKCHP